MICFAKFLPGLWIGPTRQKGLLKTGKDGESFDFYIENLMSNQMIGIPSGSFKPPNVRGRPKYSSISSYRSTAWHTQAARLQSIRATATLSAKWPYHHLALLIYFAALLPDIESGKTDLNASSKLARLEELLFFCFETFTGDLNRHPVCKHRLTAVLEQ